MYALAPLLGTFFLSLAFALLCQHFFHTADTARGRVWWAAVAFAFLPAVVAVLLFAWAMADFTGECVDFAGEVTPCPREEYQRQQGLYALIFFAMYAAWNAVPAGLAFWAGRIWRRRRQRRES
jgi:hypothetical protein